MLLTSHPEEQLLLRGILDNLEDDAPRGIIADWYDEHDEPERASFIRASLRYGDGSSKYAKRDRDCRIMDRYLAQHFPFDHKTSNPQLHHWWSMQDTGRDSGFLWQRGFVAKVSVPLAGFMDVGKSLSSIYPTIQYWFLNDRIPMSVRSPYFEIHQWYVSSWSYGLTGPRWPDGGSHVLPLEFGDTDHQSVIDSHTLSGAYQWLSDRCMTIVKA